jgi:hypothetical protein
MVETSTDCSMSRRFSRPARTLAWAALMPNATRPAVQIFWLRLMPTLPVSLSVEPEGVATSVSGTPSPSVSITLVPEGKSLRL